MVASTDRRSRPNDSPMIPMLDAEWFRSIYAGDMNGRWSALMLTLTAIGGGWAMLAIVPLFAQSRTRAFAIALTFTLGATSLTVFVLKSIVRRARPCVSLEGVHALCVAPSDYSFPSGHSAGSFAAAAFFSTLLLSASGAAPSDDAAPIRSALTRALGAAALFVVASGVALSRVYLGVHFPGDVIAGASLGIGFGIVGGRLHAARIARGASVSTNQEATIREIQNTRGERTPHA